MIERDVAQPGRRLDAPAGLVCRRCPASSGRAGCSRPAAPRAARAPPRRSAPARRRSPPRAAAGERAAGRSGCRRPRGSSSAPARLGGPRVAPRIGAAQHRREAREDDVDVLVLAHERVGAGVERAELGAARPRRRSAAGTACGAARRRAGSGGSPSRRRCPGITPSTMMAAGRASAATRRPSSPFPAVSTA